MPQELKPVGDQTVLDCGIILSVRCVRKGLAYECAMYSHSEAVSGLTLSKVGTALQRQVYECLRRSYADAINERNPVGEIDEG